MVNLRLMAEAEYNDYLLVLRERYAGDRARNLRESLESQLKAADRQIADLLPQGVKTPNHFLWRVEAVDGEVASPVGVLWVYLDSTAHKAFIYDIELDEAYRGKGYGTEVLIHLEDIMRKHGVVHIGLNVFGDNQVAFHLYQKLGYYTAATSMQKDLPA